jgi:resuscitation-promoting factor RpfB
LGFLLVTTMTALVAIAAGVLVELHTSGAGSDPAAMALAAIPSSHSATLLEEERQQMILVDAASKTLSIVSAPKLATSPASSASDQAGGGGGAPLINFPAPDPGTAQSIAFNLLPSYGFSSSQWSCLDALWNRESGWVYDAENASGAYGIPQALPGDKMASAGPDWETDPTTQIKWGLGYIQSTYGTPCDAWDHEEADGWY